MPSAPFGQHPTLIEYIEWAEGQGCIIKHGVVGTTNCTIIFAPGGQHWVPHIGPHDERLAPTTVARLDRRIGLNSPFPSLDDQGEND